MFLKFVVSEASLGHPDAASRRMVILNDIPELAASEELRTLGKALIAGGSLPSRSEIDAHHIAVATIHGIEYLLTWNGAHIANAIMRPKIKSLCREYGYEPPIICTPQELMEG